MNINLIAPINQVSYGIVGLNLLQQLDKVSNVTLWGAPCSHNVHVSEDSTELISKCMARQSDFDYEAPSVRLWHQFSMGEHVGRGPRYGFPIFELDSFTTSERHQLEWLDGIVVCSKWAAGVAKEQLGKHTGVHVVPLGVDRNIFYPQPELVDNQYTTFLCVGKWELRKGHDILIDAFNAAFETTDRVRLWMLSHNFFLEPDRNNGVDGNAEWMKKYKQSKLGHKIDILSRVESHTQVARIMKEVDCGVFPSRAEGWNLELLEMMACGKQVIATNYSGHTEFVDDVNCKLIDIDETEEAYDGKFFFGSDKEHGQWARLDLSQHNQLIEHMRAIHLSKKTGSLPHNTSGVATSMRLSWQDSAKKLLEAVDN